MNKRLLLLLWICISLGSGCRLLSPKTIDNSRQNVASELIRANTSPIERGQHRPVLDGVGWVVGIPSKILLWDHRIENHRIGSHTEETMAEYLRSNDLEHVKVRLNQYRPWDDMKRLTKNRSMAWPWRYSIGTFSVLGETVFPGRIFGGDHFNPYTQTIHLYSDVPAIALHEGAHAKDFSRRNYPGIYAALYGLPIVPLYHEAVATSDAIAYTQQTFDQDLQREAYRVLYPAYGTYVGGALGTILPIASVPAYYGGVVLGHVLGRWQAAGLGSQALLVEPEASTVRNPEP